MSDGIDNNIKIPNIIPEQNPLFPPIRQPQVFVYAVFSDSEYQKICDGTKSNNKSIQ